MSNDARPNRLARETSPYLRQHSHNPVDWYPWGAEALQRARDLDRPIFLSVGYSSCHWCHVMERESFEDPRIAALMNELFVNIKVDREERPDIDAIYMTAVQLLTGSGGWPMSVFLTPDLRPYWGGTYFPPTSRGAMPGFPDVLREVARAYRERRDQVEQTATLLTERLAAKDAEGGEGLPGRDIVSQFVDHSRRSFDGVYGGFGPAPKFPRSIDVSLLLRSFARHREPDVIEMCERTLDAMALGGIYDQIGGGFHRYATDRRWLVPHFEKMLYDNALLARTYTEAFQLTAKPLYARIAREVLDYTLREMTSPEGGFYSATDADSEGHEGRFFVWTPEQVEEALGKDHARFICHHFNITPGGNFEGRTSVPHVTRPVEESAKAFGLTAEEGARIIAVSRRELYRVRDRRPRPFRDEKLLTSWNALMVSALARASRALGESRFGEAAARAARRILEEQVDDDRLLRVRMDGRSTVEAFLDDHAYLVEALLDLYESTFDLEYLRQARHFADILLERFWDDQDGGFYYTDSGREALIARRKDPFDNATPSGNGVAAMSLLRLALLAGDPRYRERAEALLGGVRRTLERVPAAFASTLLAVDFSCGPAVEVAIVGDLDDERTLGLLQAVNGEFLPAAVLAVSSPQSAAQAGADVPLLAGKGLLDGRPAAYVCRDYACRAPVTDPQLLVEALRRPPSTAS